MHFKGEKSLGVSIGFVILLLSFVSFILSRREEPQNGYAFPTFHPCNHVQLELQSSHPDHHGCIISVLMWRGLFYNIKS